MKVKVNIFSFFCVSQELLDVQSSVDDKLLDVQSSVADKVRVSPRRPQVPDRLSVKSTVHSFRPSLISDVLVSWREGEEGGGLGPYVWGLGPYV